MAKTVRIGLRLLPDDKELIEEAAQLLGMNLTEFASSRLVALARRTIQEHNVTRLTKRDRDIFIAMLEAGKEPNASLTRAFRDVR